MNINKLKQYAKDHKKEITLLVSGFVLGYMICNKKVSKTKIIKQYDKINRKNKLIKDNEILTDIYGIYCDKDYYDAIMSKRK